MINGNRKVLLILVSFTLSVFLFGCATTKYQAHPQLEMRSKDVASAALISPEASTRRPSPLN